jgi:hypothetical protein
MLAARLKVVVARPNPEARQAIDWCGGRFSEIADRTSCGAGLMTDKRPMGFREDIARNLGRNAELTFSLEARAGIYWTERPLGQGSSAFSGSASGSPKGNGNGSTQRGNGGRASSPAFGRSER